MIAAIIILFFIGLTTLLGWYCYKLTSKLLFLSENLEDLYTRLQEFDEHINFIHELEMYYGDETLKNLIRHSRDLRNYMTTFKDTIELADEEETDETTETTEDSDTEETEAEDSPENKKFLSAAGKTIFYQGT